MSKNRPTQRLPGRAPAQGPGPADRGQMMEVMLTRQEIHIRPLPSPQDMELYKGISEEIADKILAFSIRSQEETMALVRQEQEARHAINERAMTLEELRDKRFHRRFYLGSWLGIASVILVLVVVALFNFTGNSEHGRDLGIGVLAALVLAFSVKTWKGASSPPRPSE